MKLSELWRISPRYRAIQRLLRTGDTSIPLRNALAALKCEEARLHLLEREAIASQDTQIIPAISTPIMPVASVVARAYDTEPMPQLRGVRFSAQHQAEEAETERRPAVARHVTRTRKG